MTTQNEAAERVEALAEYVRTHRRLSREDIRQTIRDEGNIIRAAERRAMVERIRERLAQIGWNLRKDPSALAEGVNRILDEEAR